MKDKITEIIECEQELLKKYLNGENIVVEFSDLIVRTNRLLKSYESLEENILALRANKKKIYTSRNLVLNKKEVNKVAYFLARYEHVELSDKKQTPALREIANKLGIKFSTLKNRRDAFDGHVKKAKEDDNEKKRFPFTLTPRNGWGDDEHHELSKELQEIYDECNDTNKKPYKQLLKEVKEILGL